MMVVWLQRRTAAAWISLQLLCLLPLASAASTAEERIEEIKLGLWKRGAFALDEKALFDTDDVAERLERMEFLNGIAPMRLGPVRAVRLEHREEGSGQNWIDAFLRVRGGSAASASYNRQMAEKIEELGKTLGSDFLDAIELNIKEHREDCEKSCESYYCAAKDKATVPMARILEDGNTTIRSYSMGAAPPEDFSSEFGFPLDLIKVTQGKPLFSREEAREVIANAEAEGVDKNEYQSGKYQLGGDWLTNLPNTRSWFNDRLETTFFPLLAHIFPEVVSSASVLRAHSVSLLKYNSSHPRTDVHVDNGILAMTLAMTPQEEYVGGGTFFEHFDTVLPMDVGHGTFRPGSVRHGGHRVTDGTRYILGAFLLIEDRVEHVRRLKNRGSKLRTAGDMQSSKKHFEWALALNPKCTTCMKDLAEILHRQEDFVAAEANIRRALELLEEKDSDALFTLGMLLSEQGKNEESIQTYKRALELNDEDAQLLYNLGIKLGEMGDSKEEMRMYAQATRVDPTFGAPWLNWGTALAQSGQLDDAELMFEKALACKGDVAPKAMMNLSILYKQQAEQLAQAGNLEAAMTAAKKASSFVDSARPILDGMSQDSEVARYVQQARPLRLQCHRTVASIFAGMQDFASAEAELRLATENFPDEKVAWQMFARILEVQGKTDEMNLAVSKLNSLP